MSQSEVIQVQSSLGNIEPTEFDLSIDLEVENNTGDWIQERSLYWTKLWDNGRVTLVRRLDSGFGGQIMMCWTDEWQVLRTIGWRLNANKYLSGNVPIEMLPRAHHPSSGAKRVTMAAHVFIAAGLRRLECKGLHVSHCGIKDQKGYDYKLDLRFILPQMQGINMRSVPLRKKSPYCGVNQMKGVDGFMVKFRNLDGNILYARFATSIDAARWYNAVSVQNGIATLEKLPNKGDEFKGNLCNPVGENLARSQKKQNEFEKGVSISRERYSVNVKAFDAESGKFEKGKGYIGTYCTLEEANAVALSKAKEVKAAKDLWASKITVPRNWIQNDGSVLFPASNHPIGQKVDLDFAVFLVRQSIRSIWGNGTNQDSRGKVTIQGEKALLYRLVSAYRMGISVTDLPSKLDDGELVCIDHANGNHRDARTVNLRFATHSTNARNQESTNIYRKKGAYVAYVGAFNKRFTKSFSDSEKATTWVTELKRLASVAITLEQVVINKMSPTDIVMNLQQQKNVSNSRIKTFLTDKD